MVNRLPAPDPTEKVRIYVDNNDWRTIPFNELRTVLLLTTEQAEHAVRRLIAEQYVSQVSADGDIRKQKNPSPRALQLVQPATAAQSTEKTESLILDKPVNIANEPQTTELRKRPMTPRENRELIIEALHALRDLTPDGLTAEELHDLLGKKGRFETIRYGLKIAREQHHSVRIERCKASSTRNNGRGYIIKHFWVGGCEPTDIFDPARAVPQPDVEHFPSAQGHPNMHLTHPEPSRLHDVPPAAAPRAASDTTNGLIAAAKTRATDIEQLLKAVEPLNEELRLLHGLLALHHAD